MKKAKVAVLGYGTVGSGVVEVMDRNHDIIAARGADLEVKYVLDLRDFEGSPIQERIVHDVDIILNDPEISVVCETMGGVGAAYRFSQKALEKGISVCTSNKELVEKHGAELMETARAHRCSYLYEASVGGGIPIIRTIQNALTAERIERIYGILNGTTNYILTKMAREGAELSTVLREAQEMGYAEKDPTADIEGHDPCRKIAILASLVTGTRIEWSGIRCEGITRLTREDFAYAAALDSQIKLIAMCEFTDAGVYALVAPRLIWSQSPLTCAQDVFNAVLLRSDMLGDSLYYGRGAGKLATASAVVGDAAEAALRAGETIGGQWSAAAGTLREIDDYEQRYFVRLRGEQEARGEEIRAAFGAGRFLQVAAAKGEFGYVTETLREGDFLRRVRETEGVLGYLRYDAPEQD